MSAQSDGKQLRLYANDDDIDLDSDDDDFLQHYQKPPLLCSKYGVGLIHSDGGQRLYVSVEDEVQVEQFDLQNNEYWRTYLHSVAQFDDTLIRDVNSDVTDLHILISTLQTTEVKKDVQYNDEVSMVDTSGSVDEVDPLLQQCFAERDLLADERSAFERQRAAVIEQRHADAAKQIQVDEIRHKISAELVDGPDASASSRVKRAVSMSSQHITDSTNQMTDHSTIQQLNEQRELLQQQLLDLQQRHSTDISAHSAQVSANDEESSSMHASAVVPFMSTSALLFEADTPSIDYTGWLQEAEHTQQQQHAQYVAEQKRLLDEHIAAEQAKLDKIEQHKRQIIELEQHHKQLKQAATTATGHSTYSAGSVVVDTVKQKAEQERAAMEQQRVIECIMMMKADMESRQLHDERERIAAQTQQDIQAVLQQLIDMTVAQHIIHLRTVQQAEHNRVQRLRHAAATSIQACYRRHIAVRLYGRRKQMIVSAVIVIQCAVRGWLCRSKQPYSVQIKRMILLRQLIRNEAAIVVQCNWRGHYLRRRLHVIKQWASRDVAVDDGELVAIDESFYSFRPMDELFEVKLPEQALHMLHTGLQIEPVAAKRPAASDVSSVVSITQTTHTAPHIPPLRRPPSALANGRTGALQHHLNNQINLSTPAPAAVHTSSTTTGTVTTLPALVARIPRLPSVHTSRSSSSQRSARSSTSVNSITLSSTDDGVFDSSVQIAMQWMQRKHKQHEQRKHKNKQLTAGEKLDKMRAINQHARQADAHATISQLSADSHNVTLEPYLTTVPTLPLLKCPTIKPMLLPLMSKK